MFLDYTHGSAMPSGGDKGVRAARVQIRPSARRGTAGGSPHELPGWQDDTGDHSCVRSGESFESDNKSETRLYKIDNASVHKLVKEKHGKATVVERSAALAVTEPVEKLILAIHDLYAGKASKGYGRFEADEINYSSAAILRNTFVTEKTSFVNGSKLLLAVLASKAGAVPLSTGGYVLIARITDEVGTSWFIVAMITNVDGSVIDDVTLEVVTAMHVDLEHLRVAGRVNLTDWQAGHEDVRYVGFLKQRGEVADYFKQFLGCDELVADVEETKKLVSALKKFAKSEGMTRTAEEEFLNAAYGHCDDRNKNDEPLSLETLSNAIFPTEPKSCRRRSWQTGCRSRTASSRMAAASGP